MDAAEHDVLAYMTFPEQHRVKLHSTNPLERLNKEVTRRADVVGIFPNEGSITRLIGAVLLEQYDEYQLQCRYMELEGVAALATPRSRRSRSYRLPPRPPDRCGPRPHPILHLVDGRDLIYLRRGQAGAYSPTNASFYPNYYPAYNKLRTINIYINKSFETYEMKSSFGAGRRVYLPFPVYRNRKTG